jgi:hypothetical protein
MAIVCTVQPTQEPITLQEAKDHLRVTGTDEDSLITSLIVSARLYAEMLTRRVFVTQTWKMVIDQFPMPGMNISSANWYGPQWGTAPGPLTSLRPDGKTGYEIYLMTPPIQSITSVKYYDINGVQQTLDPATYLLDNVTEPSRLVPAPNTNWPSTQNRINAVEVLFVAGYGTPLQVPEGIKSWIKLRIATLYDHRAEIDIIQRAQVIKLPHADGLLDPYRVFQF